MSHTCSAEIDTALTVFLDQIAYSNKTPSNMFKRVNARKPERQQRTWQQVEQHDIELFKNTFKMLIQERINLLGAAILTVDYNPQLLLQEIFEQSKLPRKDFFQRRATPFIKGNIVIKKGSVTLTDRDLKIIDKEIHAI